LQTLVASAMLLEKIDKPERRGIMLLAHLCRRFLAHALGEIAPHRLEHQQWSQIGTGALRFLSLQNGLARSPAQLVMSGHEPVHDARSARLGGAEHAA